MQPFVITMFIWIEGTTRTASFQSAALPTELPGPDKVSGIRPGSFAQSQEH